MKIVLFHLTGNANVKGAAYAFADAGLLYEYDVTIASFPNSLSDKLAAFGPFEEISRRQLPDKLKPYTHTWPWMEIGRILLPKVGLRRFVNQPGAPFFVDAAVQNLDRHVARRLPNAQRKGATAVYGYEDTTVHSFRAAKQLGMKCLYDLPIGYWKAAQRLLREEQNRWPQWASTINILKDPQGKLDRKEEELEKADAIFVASSFTAATLRDYGKLIAPVKVIPYGFPQPEPSEKEFSYDGKRPLKLLFVGSLSQRKGIADLFASVAYFGKEVELTVVGNLVTQDCAPLNEALQKHRWIPSLSHKDILNLMRKQDVLVFPSLFEGFGLVITEAMSQGTPVITTDRTAGPDIITHNIDGWLIEAGSTPALINAISHLLNHPEKVAQAGMAAKRKAAQRSWSLYGTELAQAVRAII